ncbi:hypothetical protein GQ457_13G018540 [Hibiscus cannabinus]
MSELSGRSLSDSDLVHRWKVLTKKAKKGLALGKRLGAEIEGNEEGAYSELERMRIVTWNIMGMGTEVKLNAVRKIIRDQRAEILLLQETKKDAFSDLEISKLWVDDQFDFRFSGAVGRSGGLLVIWDKSKFVVDLVQTESNFLLLKGKWLQENVMLRVINCNILGGDFIAIRNRGERCGCREVFTGMKEFNYFIESCNLVDLPLIGKKFTWFGPVNRRSRIDIFLVDDDCLLKFKNLIQLALGRSCSDHAPIVLHSEEKFWGPKPFKFVNGWLKNKDCREKILDFLRNSGKFKAGLGIKLKKLKGRLRRWNSKENVNFGSRIKELKRKINDLEEEGNDGAIDFDKLDELKEYKMELWELLELQEDLLRQQARVKWISKGDTNSAYFHRIVKIRAKKRSNCEA